MHMCRCYQYSPSACSQRIIAHPPFSCMYGSMVKEKQIHSLTTFDKQRYLEEATNYRGGALLLALVVVKSARFLKIFVNQRP